MPVPIYGVGGWRKQSRPIRTTWAGRIKLPFAVTALLILLNAQLFVVILLLYLIYEAMR